MVLVPAGEFIMGSNDGQRDEQPVHSVYVDEYWIDKTEVTNGQYAACVDAGGCDPPSDSSSNIRDKYYGNPDFDSYPVMYVSWIDAHTFCTWREARLPTEAEWEKAARGQDGRTYPWGEGISCSQANYSAGEGGCVGDTSAVGSYPDGASPYGTLDMVGNVWEWVADWYDEDYYARSPYSNPQGPEDAPPPPNGRVVRGGSATDPWFVVNTTYRSVHGPQHGANEIGFRCVRSP
jgi:formylglycine-generating enzyme required for sulfatase activity